MLGEQTDGKTVKCFGMLPSIVGNYFLEETATGNYLTDET
jgi:hypothetical protein